MQLAWSLIKETGLAKEKELFGFETEMVQVTSPSLRVGTVQSEHKIDKHCIISYPGTGTYG